MTKYLKLFKSLIDELIIFDTINGLISKIEFKINDQTYIVKSLSDENLSNLYEYFNSFKDNEKEYFGFPLFTPINKNFNDFKKSYQIWTKERYYWNVLILFKKEDLNEVIAMSYIKKMNFVNSNNEEFKSPTWFNSVKTKFRMLRLKHKKNLRLSYLMGLLVIVQAEHKNIKEIYARGRNNDKAVENYILSLGFIKTGRKFIVNKENFSFEDIEYLLTLK